MDRLTENVARELDLVAVGIAKVDAVRHPVLDKLLHGQIGMGLLDFVVGILELISEISKIISLSFRLFGNIFAGEVLLVVISFLVPYIAPLPFLGLEIFVGFVQAPTFPVVSVRVQELG